MFKMSALYKATLFAILLALVLASLPTATAVAKGTNESLEKKWTQLINNYDMQMSNHNGAHRWVDHWLQTHKKASASKEAEIRKHLEICNSAIMAAGVIVSQHTGFDADGNLVSRAAAIQSIKDLSYYLQKHAGSVKNLSEHINS